MAVLDHNTTLSNLKKKGFKEVHGNHIFLEFWYEGKITGIYTKLSHNKQDIGNTLIKLMADQVKLDKENFKKLAICTLSEKQYIEILKSNKEI